jgi:pimeloyl-ACP methyl ester carboxylesterase
MLNTIRVGELNVLRAVPDVASHRPVLFVHGYFVDATVWTPWLERFASHGIPAYAVHLRGRAGSRPSVDPGRASIEDFADDAELVAREIAAAAVVGHSMGGLIAQKVAERGDIGAVVLITPAPPRGISVLSLPLALRQLRYFPAILLSRPVRPGREDLRALVLNRVPARDQYALLDLMIPDSGRAGRDMSITGVPVDPGRVKCPMLVVSAEHDRFIPPRVVARIAERYDAPLVTVPGHGHMVIVEPGWEHLADHVEQWIREHRCEENPRS